MTTASGVNATTNGVGLRTVASEVGGDGVVKAHIRTRWWRARRSASSLVSRSLGTAAVMTVACGATMLVASRVRGGSPWTGLNAVATALGIHPKRAKRRFGGATTRAGASVLAAGAVVLAGLCASALAALATGRRRSPPPQELVLAEPTQKLTF